MSPEQKKYYSEAPEHELPHMARQDPTRWTRHAQKLGIPNPEFYTPGIHETTKRLFTPITIGRTTHELNLGPQHKIEEVPEGKIVIYTDEKGNNYVAIRSKAPKEIQLQAIENAKELGYKAIEQNHIITPKPTRDQVIIYAGKTPHTAYETLHVAQLAHHDATNKDEELDTHAHGLVTLIGNNDEEVNNTIEEAKHWTPRYDTRNIETAAEIIEQKQTIEETGNTPYHAALSLAYMKELSREEVEQLWNKLLPGGKLVIPTDEKGNYLVFNT